MAEQVEVFVSIGGRDVLAGQLWSRRRRRVESQSFSYEARYLGMPDAYALDPMLPLVDGSQHTPQGRAIFGAFSDCSPDRWGKRLINRGERRRAERVGGTPRGFSEADYLLGVRDDLRQGAIRFREPGNEHFLARPESGVPSLLDLPTLLSAAERAERDQESDEELATLLRGGSSLGGARPKAHVLDDLGRIAIAKFPSPASDEWNVIRWEAAALRLAAAAGIRVPRSSLHAIGHRSVLVVDRFDRYQGERIGYASAMTMLERTDGDDGSYLEIAEALEMHSPSTAKDLAELWRRIAFSILISNLDDHLRNHAFLRDSTAGWRLSPAFDLNPDPRPGERHLATAVDIDDTTASLDSLMRVADAFRLTSSAAVDILREVYDAVETWPTVATRLGAAKEELRLLEPAFDHAAKVEARRILRSELAADPTREAANRHNTT